MIKDELGVSPEHININNSQHQFRTTTKMLPQNNDQNLLLNGTINHNNNNNNNVPSPIAIPSIKLFGAGPTSLNPSVVAALKTPILSPLNPAFIEVLNDVKAGLRHLFQTSNPFTFAISGTGHAGLECALLNLLEKGDKILVVENGRWGQCVRQMAEERHGLEMAILAEKWGKAVELEAFKRAVSVHKPSVVFVCHGETSTGVLQPLDGFGQCCRENGALLLVNVVGSLGVVPFLADQYEIDCAYSACQKFNCPPRLAPITFKIKYGLGRAKCQFIIWMPSKLEICGDALGNQLRVEENFTTLPRQRIKLFKSSTLPITSIYALREAIALVHLEGLERRWKRHKMAAEYLRMKLEGIGMEMFVVEESHRLPSMTTVLVPTGNTEALTQFHNLMLQKGYEISTGLGEIANKILRISLFGNVANKGEIDQLVDVIKECMEETFTNVH